ncbi:hypothetical protein P154DRAFT_527911 [Amniculicola lignicola CBS 123094]|uniref:Uncharacterized protein n=1 Tax=Amniculicola lignicola CBS 123094 TaxID=1392246 RepID=A0A6A5VW87_9PLEO|nr:hypothetical protein P154DRAFT_527911 [Amniculicola lignicola CBS 123094]
MARSNMIATIDCTARAKGSRPGPGGRWHGPPPTGASGVTVARVGAGVYQGPHSSPLPVPQSTQYHAAPPYRHSPANRFCSPPPPRRTILRCSRVCQRSPLSAPPSSHTDSHHQPVL